MSNHTNIHDDDTLLRPFEWLTDSVSVDPLIESAIASFGDSSSVKVLHVGSGSSILGEHIVTSQTPRIDQVVNVDKDAATLEKMEKRWKTSASIQHQEKLTFLPMDFAGSALPFPDGHFHIAVDKSTLDCTLCSDSATAGLLSEVYRLLNPQGGTYILISFHHVDLLQPLLENMPGADWQVSHSIMSRQIEDLIGANNKSQQFDTGKNNNSLAIREGGWTSGLFEPDEQYRRTVNVFICRKQGQENPPLDRNLLIEHVHDTNDKWFQTHNPMLTTKRKEMIRKLFEDHKSKAILEEEGVFYYELPLAYQLLFTDEEREHFDYEYFLEDWQAWTADQNNASVPNGRVSVEAALAFLQEMQ